MLNSAKSCVVFEVFENFANNDDMGILMILLLSGSEIFVENLQHQGRKSLITKLYQKISFSGSSFTGLEANKICQSGSVYVSPFPIVDNKNSLQAYYYNGFQMVLKGRY